MKKLTLIFVIIAVLSLLMVGSCGGNGDNDETSAATSSQTSNQTSQPSSSEPEATTTESSGGNGGSGFTWNDVPIYGGASQVQEFNISIPPEEGEYSRVEWRYYETNDDIDKVVTRA